MGGTSLVGLQEHIKLARDYAVEGLYDTSVIFFDGAVAQINKYSFFLCFFLGCFFHVLLDYLCLAQCLDLEVLFF